MAVRVSGPCLRQGRERRESVDKTSLCSRANAQASSGAPKEGPVRWAECQITNRHYESAGQHNVRCLGFHGEAVEPMRIQGRFLKGCQQHRTSPGDKGATAKESVEQD